MKKAADNLDFETAIHLRDRINKLKKTVIMLMPGEYFATKKDQVLYTVLGSCIATCIYDKKKKSGWDESFFSSGNGTFR